MTPRDTLPSKWEIASFWAGMDGYRLCDRMGIDPESPMCFACRFYRPSWDAPKAPSDRWNKAPLVRAHIIAHASGGSASADNLVLFCKSCHDAAPMVLERSETLHWVTRREHWELTEYRELMDQATRLGIDINAYASMPADRREAAETRAARELRPELHWDGVREARFTTGTRAVLLRRAAEILGLEIRPRNSDFPLSAGI